MPLTRKLANLSQEDTDTAGGKGASLGEMAKANIPIPSGFVVLTQAFNQFIEDNNLKAEIDAALHNVRSEEAHTVEEASERIRGHILNAHISDGIKTAIQEGFSGLNTDLLAVRSSATAEDASKEAWAGQLESFLNVTGDSLVGKVRECWASLFTPRAIFYRSENNLHDQEISVAVVVQEMVRSRAAGVAFSVHPVTEDRNQMIIEAGFGLGDAVVGGEITPDNYIVEKEPREIIDITINTQKKVYTYQADTGNTWKSLPDGKATKQVISKQQIHTLADIIEEIENHYGFPVDVEWAMEDGKIYVVQSRPITTLKHE